MEESAAENVDSDDAAPSTSSQSIQLVDSASPRRRRSRRRGLVVPRAYTKVTFFSSYRIELPEEGVFNKQGYLFHHVVPDRLMPEHIDRLQEFGIRYQRGAHFTAEEDERIKSNWRRFANDFGFQYEDAICYICHHISMGTQVKRAAKKMNNLLVSLAMWPRLCRKLEHRTARQIRDRMLTIMDRYHIGTSDLMTLGDTLEAFRLLQDGVSIFDLAVMMRRPVIGLSRALAARRSNWMALTGLSMEEIIDNPKLLENLVMKRSQYRRFFDRVLLKAGITEFLVRDVIARDRTLAVIEKQLQDFNWTLMLSEFPSFNERSIVEQWNIMMSELCTVFVSKLDSEDVDVHCAWMIVINGVMPASRFSPHDVITYVKVLRKCVSADAPRLEAGFIEQRKMASKLHGKGLLDADDVISWTITKCQYYERLRLVYSKLLHKFTDDLRFPLSVKDKLKILRVCYQKVRDANNTWTDDSRSLPSVYASTMVESIIDIMLKIDPDWRPPKLYQKWIKSAKYIALFNKRSDNSELGGAAKNINVFRKTFFDDKSCLRSFSFTASRGLVRASQPNLEAWEHTEEVANFTVPAETPVHEKSLQTRLDETDRVGNHHKKKRRGWAQEEDLVDLDREDEMNARSHSSGHESGNVVLDDTMFVPRRKKRKYKQSKYQLEIEDGEEPRELNRTDFNPAIDETIMAGLDVTAFVGSSQRNQVKTPRVAVPDLSPVRRKNKIRTPLERPASDSEEPSLVDAPANTADRYDEDDPYKHLLVAHVPDPSSAPKQRQASPILRNAEDYLNIFG